MNEQIKNIIAEVLAEIKSYKLPAVCCSYGLEKGDESEAFKSKYKYVYSRLETKSYSELLEIAKNVDNNDSSSNKLKDFLKKEAEKSAKGVSDLTRRKIIKDIEEAYQGIYEHEISGNLTLEDFSNKIWGAAIPNSLQNLFQLNELGSIFNVDSPAKIKNIIENMNLINCSQFYFFKFLEVFVSPEVKYGKDQVDWVNRINKHLEKDSFGLIPDGEISGEVIYRIKESNNIQELGIPSKSLEEKIRYTGIEPIEEEFKKALENVDKKPKDAVEAAKNILESTFRSLLDDRDYNLNGKEKFPELWAMVKKELNMKQDNNNLKNIASGLGTVVNSINDLRNDVGGGHGVSGSPKTNIKLFKPAPRHARLAINAAHTIVVYIFEVWKPLR